MHNPFRPSALGAVTHWLYIPHLCHHICCGSARSHYVWHWCWRCQRWAFTFNACIFKRHVIHGLRRRTRTKLGRGSCTLLHIPHHRSGLSDASSVWCPPVPLGSCTLLHIPRSAGRLPTRGTFPAEATPTIPIISKEKHETTIIGWVGGQTPPPGPKARLVVSSK